MKQVYRLNYIDICKWLGISLVIFGHMKMPNEMLQWIYAFHMPSFFVLSGYTYRQQKIDKDFIIKKIKTIYIPFLLFALIFCKGDFSSWAYIAYGSRNALNMAGTYTVLWFLPCFFVAVIIFSIKMNISNKFNNKLKTITAHMGGVILMLIAVKICEHIKEIELSIEKFGYPFNFDMAFVGAVFMVAGYYFKQIIDWLNAQKQWLLLAIVTVLFVITGFTAYMNLPESLNPECAHVEMSVGALGNWGLFFMNALLMSFALIGLSVAIDKWISKKKLLLFIGQNSLTILCIHGTILLVASKVLPKLGLVGTDDMSLVLQGVVAYVIVITVSIPAIILIKRFAPNLVGK